ncbi:MAG: M20 family metallopeptidase [Candidatus Hermodarchaeota archaeon]
MDPNELKRKLIRESKDLESYIIKTRRLIHMDPETAFEEENTANFIEEELNKIGYKTQKTAKTGVIASIEGLNKGRTVALRADIDALNITEENDISYRSKNLGKMHACGHDSHTAMLLGAAQILYNNKKHFQGPIKLIFQPGEEGGGGGKKIIDEGHFDDVDVVFGIHVWQDLPSGIIATREGAMLASSDRFSITITGKGGHVATPHQTIDPTAVVSNIYDALQKVVSREINPLDPCILALPMISGSNAHNIIPNVAALRGTFRTLNPEVRNYFTRRIHEIVVGFSKAWRCDGKVEFDPLAYPPLINNAETVIKVKDILQELDDVSLMSPSMIGEDFAFYLQKVKGVFLVLGIHNEEKGIVYPHHHPKFQVDESILWKGTAVYSILGFYWLFDRFN